MTSLLLNSHLDTVGVERMTDPFTLRQVEDKLYGHGVHTVDEWVSLKSLVRVYDVLKELIAAF